MPMIKKSTIKQLNNDILGLLPTPRKSLFANDGGGEKVFKSQPKILAIDNNSSKAMIEGDYLKTKKQDQYVINHGNDLEAKNQNLNQMILNMNEKHGRNKMLDNRQLDKDRISTDYQQSSNLKYLQFRKKRQ